MPERIPTFKPRRAGPAIDTRLYDRTRRNRSSKAFYDSTAWKRLRAQKLAGDPLCEDCKQAGRITPAKHVHHERSVAEAAELALDLANLTSLCVACHNARPAR
jgi:5-methylcytosine-specific restriction enzyme A